MPFWHPCYTIGEFEMFRQAATARREIAYNMAAIGITPDPETRRNVRLAVDRDLQAQRLRPNVPVPPRRAVLSYLKTMRAETGSFGVPTVMWWPCTCSVAKWP